MITSLIFLAVLVPAQGVPIFPASFSISLTELPSAQSSTQRFFGCPYVTGDIQHKITKVYSTSGTSLAPVVYAEVQYWITENGLKKCAGSITRNFTLAPSVSSGALGSNLNSSINAAFLIEAQSNNQITSGLSTIGVGN